MLFIPDHIWNEIKYQLTINTNCWNDPIILFNQTVHFRDTKLLDYDKKLTFSKAFKDYGLT